MPKFRELTKQLLVVPCVMEWMNKRWLPVHLGAGTVVRLPSGAEYAPNPVGIPDEVLVYYQDAAQREVPGYLARTATAFMKQVRGPSRYVTAKPETLAPMEQLRDRIGSSGLPAYTWLITKGRRMPKLLRAALRDTGVRVKRSDSADERVIKAIRAILNQEVTMQEIEDTTDVAPAKRTKKGAKRAAKKGGAKRAAREEKAGGRKRASRDEAPARSMSRSAGEALLAVKGLNGSVKSFATKLANDGELSKKQLQQLRDAINEAATEARANDKPNVASQLSAANRLVRRLHRAA
jgi:hypothetical protein